MDASKNIYVADLDGNRVQKLSPLGTVITKWGSQRGSGDGQFNGPCGVAVDNLGNVYVADTGNHRIQKLQQLLRQGH